MLDVAQNKRKMSVTLDEDLVAALEETEENLSAQINEAVRLVVEERRRRQDLRQLLDQLEATDGPPDEAEVRRFLELLA